MKLYTSRGSWSSWDTFQNSSGRTSRPKNWFSVLEDPKLTLNTYVINRKFFDMATVSMYTITYFQTIIQNASKVSFAFRNIYQINDQKVLLLCNIVKYSRKSIKIKFSLRNKNLIRWQICFALVLFLCYKNKKNHNSD